MQTIVSTTDDNQSILNVDDNATIEITDDGTFVRGEGVPLLIPDCKPANTVIFKNTEPPEDWNGGKYFYTEENGWELNPEYEALMAKAEAQEAAFAEELKKQTQ